MTCKLSAVSERSALPQEAPWWRERVALQGGEGIAQEYSEHRGSASTQTVTSDDQFILLQTRQHQIK